MKVIKVTSHNEVMITVTAHNKKNSNFIISKLLYPCYHFTIQLELRKETILFAVELVITVRT
jgi:hypothetical protein